MNSPSSSTRSKAGRPINGALRDRRREEILEAAATLFAQRGYSEATTEMLAEKLGVGKGTIYRYFPTKRDLFLGACDRLMEQLHVAIRAAAHEADDPLDKIPQAIRTYLNYFAEHPEFVELIFQERAQFKDRKTPTYFERQAVDRNERRGFFKQLIAEGRMRDLDIDRLFDVLSDVVYGTMFTNYFTGRRRSPDDQARDILDVVFNGILTDRERKQREQSHAQQ